MNIKNKRIELGLKQTDVAKAVGVSLAAYRRLNCGQLIDMEVKE
jgi:predicted transcriptional regulator